MKWTVGKWAEKFHWLKVKVNLNHWLCAKLININIFFLFIKLSQTRVYLFQVELYGFLNINTKIYFFTADLMLWATSWLSIFDRCMLALREKELKNYKTVTKNDR